MRTVVAAAVACLTIISLSNADEARAAIKKTISIPAQDLVPALQSLASEQQIHLVYLTEDVRGLRTAGAVGTLTFDETLTKILSGTGLIYRRIDEQTISILPAISAAPRSGGVPTSNTADDGLPSASASQLMGEETAARFSGATGGERSIWSRFRLARAEQTETSTGGGGSDRPEQMALEEVIVTAQRREERLQDVPISMSVLSGESLESGTISSMNDALRNVPGLAGYENSQGAMTRYSVRGVSTNTSLLNSSSVVGYYMDEIPFAFVRYPVVPDMNAYDLERVEVLKGPQGTLYGASSLNGVIRLVTQDANLEEFEFKTRTSLSSTRDGGESYGGDAAVNVPLIAGKLGMRAVAGYADESGWIDLPDAGVKDANDEQRKNLRLKVNAAPVENLGVELLTWYSRSDRGAASTSLDDRTFTPTFAPGFETDFDAHALTLTYDFPAASLTSATSYMSFDSTGLLDAGSLVLLTGLGGDLLAQEIRLSSTAEGPWKWSVGGIYREEEDKFLQYNFPEATFVPDGSGQTRHEYNARSHAFFGELSRTFFDGRVELTGGLRYYEDTNTSNELTVQNIPGVNSIPVGRSNPIDSDALTPRLVLQYRPSDETSFYASFGEGFRAGFSQSGFAIRTVGSEELLPTVAPDQLRNYEIGAKGSVLDGRVTYDLAAYFIDWKDAVQVRLVQIQLNPNDPPAGFFVPLNSQGVEGIGADAGTTIRLSDRWALGATVSWNDLHFVEDVTSGTGVLYPKDSRPPESAKLTAGGDISYSFPLGAAYSAELMGGVNYTSKMVTPGVGAPVTGDDLLRASATITLRSSSGWSAMLFGDNLTDEGGKVRPAPTTGGSDRLRPRTFGLQLEYQFR